MCLIILLIGLHETNYHWMLIKTESIVFHSKRKNIKYPSISMNNMTVERVQTYNFMCLTLNEHLTWRDHLNNVTRNISRAIVPVTILSIISNICKYF